jgi:hypothetical protein
VNHQPWHYFLSIERDFIETIDFVDLHTDNKNTYSNAYAKLLLLIGSEADVVAKMLCKQANPASAAGNIDQYRSELCAKFPGIHTTEIEIAKYNMKIQPWLSWGPVVAKSPDWWRAYNGVKHERDKHFHDANQEYTLHGLCGLMVLLLYLYETERHLQPYPQLLDYGFPSYIVTEGGKKLPGT